VNSSLRLKIQILALGVALPGAASAATIEWTNWSPHFSYGDESGTASGVMGSVDVSYLGEVAVSGGVYYDSPNAIHPSWQPASSFEGGIVSNGPPSSPYSINLVGGGHYDNSPVSTDTITFSKAVTNPVMAIWSLGSAGTPASFNFNLPGSAIEIVAGGPSAEFSNPSYSSGPLTQAGNIIYGEEGNGTIEFLGTYTSISWTNPVFEDYYAATIGAATTSAAPEPATWMLLLGGFAGLALVARTRRAKVA